MFVFSNLATSLDGKIATANRALFHLGTPFDRRQMQVLRKKSDIVLMGAATLRAHKGFCGLRTQTRQPANAILSTRLEGIDPSWPFFDGTDRRRILFVTKQLAPALARKFSRSSELILLNPAQRPVALQILDALKDRGFEKILVEGGGGLMWDFVSQNLLDEVNITLTPRLLGGIKAPTLVDGPGFQPAEVVNLKLRSCRQVGDELYLTYARRKKRG